MSRGRFPSGAPGRQPRPVPQAIIVAGEVFALDLAEAADAVRRLTFAIEEFAIELELFLDDDPYLIEPDEGKTP